jgi:protein-S-isoprenylcysteine O-methyltransferase Ste14
MAKWVGEFPFLLGLAAGCLAYACGVILRRGLALAGAGRPLTWPAETLRTLGMLSLLASFLWAWSLGPRIGSSGVITSMGTLSPAALAQQDLSLETLALSAGYGLLVLAGLALAVWSLTARIRNGVFGKSPERLANRPPYRSIRRPMTLGIGLAFLGATLLTGTLAAWACLVVAACLVWILQEIDDRELRSRIGWVAEQQRRIPRFIPRRVARRARHG